MKIDNASAAQQSQANSASQRPPDQMGKEEFLKLLTMQLAHQDPLNPMDNQKFVTQLSQLASVERLENLSMAMNNMAMAQSANTSAQVVSFIGKSVRIGSNEFEMQGGEAAQEIGFSVPEDAARVEVTIKDKDGNVVRTIEMGGCDKGEHAVEWDGLADDGTPVDDGDYTFDVKAYDSEDEEMAASEEVERTVKGVTFNGGFPQLLIGDDKSVPLGQVKEVRE
ncbi:hypothetical protein FIV42_11460 [Persicimonas caeni]|uniref:Basal-body rod modification protein FlgD n=1 Tax=Persicimonas caeni TaxID=2292766 RepID=A0A4Y6PUA0_PERCE|nr:FlgD immunoglobulin-like domain containing protein [Persicimonas caeni]QDG51335.1 hypothetical protein FIV42_11460 [Persicimonas caeni]QED32556.1 hypothetical protein FRD00_11455 [Persicimonas caeni]